MKNIAIISEYNPFHNGHLHQIKEIKKLYPDSRIISIMSGNFVQRGEPAILNKYERCKNAVDSSVDLVLQIPSIHSLQSAENFALGPFKILDELKIIDFLSFGVETENFDKLYEVGKIQFENEKIIDGKINEAMTKGVSYAKAFEMATRELVSFDVKDIFMSNNILALEYIKSKFKTGSKINLLPIKRLGSNYLSNKLEKDFLPSATAIRAEVFNGNRDLFSFLPLSTYSSLKDFDKRVDYFDLIKYNFLISNTNHKEITGYEKGLDELIIKNLKSSNNMSDFLEKTKSKRYKEGRLKRFIINCLLDINKNFLDEVMKSTPKFVNVLGFNDSGKEVLKQISNSSSISLIVNKRDFKLDDKISKNLFMLEERATDLYNIINHETKSEYEYMPYVK